MRCAQCGLPLSPARTICPRCGTSIADKAESYVASSLPGLQSKQQEKGNAPSTAQVDFASPSSQAVLQAPWPVLPTIPWDAQGSIPPQSSASPSQPIHDMDDYPQLPFPGPETPGTLIPFAANGSPSFTPAEPTGTAHNMGLPLASTSSPTWGESAGTNNTHNASNSHFAAFPAGEQAPAPSWETSVSSGGSLSAPSWGAPESAFPASTPDHQGWLPVAPSIHRDTPLPVVAGSFAPAPPATETGNPNTQATIQRTMRFGYTLSGVCMVLATLLLVVVLFINLGLPRNVSHSQPQVITPHTTAVPSPTLQQTITPTTTVTGYPGQQYIDTVTISNTHGNNAQLSSSFKVNQIAYINFSVHPNGHQGAVCLLWYINDQVFSHYEFPVQPGALTAFSYTTLKKPGDGYVQLYWASTTACVDKLLAQQISFTVSA